MSIDKRVASLITIILVGFGFAVFFFMTLRENIKNPPSSTTQTTSIPTQTIVDQNQSSNSTGELTYKSPSLGFTLNYPIDMRFQEHSDNSVTFYTQSPTQGAEDEMFNGIILNVKKAVHDSASLREFAASERDRISQEAITTSATNLVEKSYGSKDGYEFTASTLGDFRYFYLDKGNKEYILITMLVADPQNQGYEEKVKQMISSLDF